MKCPICGKEHRWKDTAIGCDPSPRILAVVDMLDNTTPIVLAKGIFGREKIFPKELLGRLCNLDGFCEYLNSLPIRDVKHKVKKQPPDLTAGEFNRREC